jgi:hypothetical protein
VFAAQVSDYADQSDGKPVAYAVARVDDPSIVRSPTGSPIGWRPALGNPVGAAMVIGLKRVAIMVLGRTFPSGNDHEARIDEVAASIGFDRIHPLGETRELPARTIDLNMARGLFVNMPFSGTVLSLLPANLRALLDSPTQ